MTYEYLLRLTLATLFGAIIGYERKRSGKPAGSRTYALVALGACLFAIVGIELSQYAGVDPSRIPSQIVVGIGFLGAGTIISAGGMVRGLTTAAATWVTAAIGLAVGLGYYAEAIASVFLLMLVLLLVPVVEKWGLRRTGKAVTLAIAAEPGPRLLERIVDILRPYALHMEEESLERTESGFIEYVLEVTLPGSVATRDLLAALNSIPEVKDVKIIP